MVALVLDFPPFAPLTPLPPLTAVLGEDFVDFVDLADFPPVDPLPVVFAKVVVVDRGEAGDFIVLGIFFPFSPDASERINGRFLLLPTTTW